MLCSRWGLPEEFEPSERVTAVEAIEAARAEFDVRGEYAEDIDAADSWGRAKPRSQRKPTRGFEPRTPSLRGKDE